MSSRSELSILDVDMGNTRIKWRLRKGDQFDYGAAAYVDEKGQENNWLAFGKLNPNKEAAPNRVRVSSVVLGQRQEQLINYCQNQWHLQPEFAQVLPNNAGVAQAYADPSRLGVDRWLGLLAAFEAIGGCVLVSCGSAVTVDLLASDGRHLGGYIVPGLVMMHHSLFKGTDRVKVEVPANFDNLQPGCDTESAVNKGTMAMIKGLVDHACEIYRADSGVVPQILITGGDGETVQRFLTGETIYNPYLVFDGLAVALP